MGMPRYFFHVRAGGDLIRDADGLELPGPEYVNEQSLKALTNLIAEEDARSDVPANFEFQVVDELGKIVLILPFCF
jgi:hypothetical protein